MNEIPDFDQNNNSRTSQDIYKIGYDSIRLLKRLAITIDLIMKKN